MNSDSPLIQKPIIAIVLSILSISLSFSQSSNSLYDEPFQFAFSRTIYSQHLGEERTILIHLPLSYETSDYNYPILIATDGDYHLFHLSGITHFQASEGVTPECILVTLPHHDRESDLLPSRNAEGFMNFIKTELVPYMEQNYRTHPFKVIMGHSYGGLFVNYALLNHHEFFNGFVAADPSLWWNNRYMERQTQNLLSQVSSFEKAYYFDQSEISQMGGIQFRNMLSSHAPTDFRWKFIHMPDDTHGSIVHKSYYFGLEWVFQDFPIDRVVITPSNRMIDDGESITVSMRHPQFGETIYYTTDGSNPTSNSYTYDGPLTITSATTLKASIVMGNNRISIPTESVFQRAVLYEATDDPGNLVAGLNYERFEGSWNRMPDLQALVPDQTGSIQQPSIIPEWNGQNNFALRITGFIDIPTTGIYEFVLSSDDGSFLFIDGIQLIDNDGLHAAEEVNGWVKLEAGLHPLEIRYFERSGEEELRLRYRVSTSNSSPMPVPTSMWKRSPQNE